MIVAQSSKLGFLIIHLELATERQASWKSAARAAFNTFPTSLVICSSPKAEKMLLSNHYLAKKEDSPVLESQIRHIPLTIDFQEVLPEPLWIWLEGVAIPSEEYRTLAEIASLVDKAFDNYAKRLQDDLRDNIYLALKVLAEGVVSKDHNRIERTDEALEKAREELFYLLYRLLFVLFAEDRGLLPVGEKGYQDKYSITKLKDTIIFPWEREEKALNLLMRGLAQEIGEDPGQSGKAGKGRLWTRIRKLFKLINIGTEGIGETTFEMRAYNGKLFSPDAHPRLDNWDIPDKALVMALHYMTRAKDRDGAYFFIDYSTLETRHLGSIYEGLLEYKVKVASEPLIAIKKGKSLVWKPDKQAGDAKPKRVPKKDLDRVKKNEIYLETVKGERKATGSYYTPDYIVRYIVEHTCGLLVREKLEVAHKAAMKVGWLPDVLPELPVVPENRENGVEPAGKVTKPEEDITGISPSVYGAAIAQLRAEGNEEVAEEAARLAHDKILELKVCDPAMGSGHFLVGALNFLAEKIVTTSGHWTKDDKVKLTKEKEAGAISKKVDEYEKTYIAAKREVVRHCLYGVDLNPLAVELAKVSLWLETVAAEKPLSFLDHHIKCGNSIIGTQLEGLHEYPKIKELVKRKQRRNKSTKFQRERKVFTNQVALPVKIPQPIIEHFTSAMKEVEGLSDDTITDVQLKEAAYLSLRKSLDYKKIKALCDLKTSIYFGNLLGESPVINYLNIVGKILQRDNLKWTQVLGKSWMETASLMAKKWNFFHWELEFPEIFYLKGENKGEFGGFDAIIGNPPYVNIKTQPDDEIGYYHIYYKSGVGRADLSVIFTERGHELLSHNGTFGYIMTNKFIHSDYGQMLQKYLANNYKLNELIDYGDSPIFVDAIAYTCILLTKNTNYIKSHKVIVREIRAKSINNVKNLTETFVNDSKMKIYNVLQTTLVKGNWANIISSENSVVKSIFRNNIIKLGKLTEFIREASACGADDIFIIESKEINKYKLEDDLIYPIIFGEQVKKFENIIANKHIIFPYKNGKIIDLSDYPLIKKYLLKFQNELEKRYCVNKGGKPWYAYHDPATDTVYNGIKILTPDIAPINNFMMFNENAVFKNTIYVIKPLHIVNSLSLISLLNTRLLTYIFSHITPHLRGDYLRYKTRFISQIPIRRIYFYTPTDAEEGTTTTATPLKGSAPTTREAHVRQLVGLYEGGLRNLPANLNEGVE